MMKSFIFLIPCGFLMATSFLLSGCQTVVLHALGSQPMPIMHEPRTDKSTSSETVVSANLSGTAFSSNLNTKDIATIGGHLDATYRLGDMFSWLFVNGSVSGSYGTLKLTCTYSDCNEEFRSIVNKKESYSSASIQERLRAGVEFTPLFLTLGASAGFHFYQDLLKFEDLRKDLKENDVIKGNPSYDVFPELRAWVGFRLGSLGKYGTFNIEGTTQLYTDDIENILMISLGYFHPSGWHGGVLLQNGPMILTAGKSFKF